MLLWRGRVDHDQLQVLHGAALVVQEHVRGGQQLLGVHGPVQQTILEDERGRRNLGDGLGVRVIARVGAVAVHDGDGRE